MKFGKSDMKMRNRFLGIDGMCNGHGIAGGYGMPWPYGVVYIRCAVLFLMGMTMMDMAMAQNPVNFKYAPAHWMTPIGWVDDWQKSLVDQTGALVYDFGPGPYARPKTRLEIMLGETPLSPLRQYLLTSRAAIVVTESASGNTRIRQTAFALVPEKQTPVVQRIQRKQGLGGSVAWANPPEGTDPAFRSVAWGTGRSIIYTVAVPASAKRRVALGFAEAHRKGKAARLMDLHVEGAASQTIDLMTLGPQHQPHVFFFDAEDDGDGLLHIEVTASAKGQDPNTLLNGLWVFTPEPSVDAAQVIDGSATPLAESFVNCGYDLYHQGLTRTDALRIERTGAPAPLGLRLTTPRDVSYDSTTGTLLFDGQPFIQPQPAPDTAVRNAQGWLLTFPKAVDQLDVLVHHGALTSALPFPNLATEQSRTLNHWLESDLPWDRITVPDSAWQALLDSSIRTVYQVREVVDGYPQFQPGATVYRGLWYGDGAWSVEAAAFLGDFTAARLMNDAMVQHQDETGRAGVMMPPLLHRETAHLIYSMCRYARLANDRAWLERNWPPLSRAMQHLADLRQQASTDPDAPYFGLFPPGLTDGGIGGVGASYGSVYWGLIGMAEAVRTAHWMNKPTEAETWGTAFDTFLATFRTAAVRDQRRDENGHLFLPIKMPFDPDKDVAQRGQWGPIHALYTGQFLEDDDPLVQGTLAMLDTRTVEDHVISLGWLTGGVWPIFDAHRALAYLWLDDTERAITLLNAFANHASPTLLWVEEQMPKNQGSRTAGDVPHTIGNVQVIRALRYLLAMEKENTLYLLRGLPASWLYPGASLSINGIPTLYGPLTLSLDINPDGQKGRLSVFVPPQGPPDGQTRIQLRALQKAGFVGANGTALPEFLDTNWGNTLHVDFIRH